MKKTWKTYALCGISILSSAGACLISGVLLEASSKPVRLAYDRVLGGKPLPVLTEFVLSSCESFSPALAGLILVVIILLGGFGVLYLAPDQISSYRRTLGCTLVIWSLAFVTLATSFMAVVLPMLPIMYGMHRAV